MGKNDKSGHKITKGRVNRFDVTPAFRGLLLDLTVTFLIEQPTDIIQFGIDYFAQLKSKYTSTVRERYLAEEEEEQQPQQRQDSPEAVEEHVEETVRPPPRVRRKSVFAEAYNPEDDADDEELPTVHPKTDVQRAALETHVGKVLIFNGLGKEELSTVLDAMFIKKIAAGEDVIKEGDEGDYFYVVESGKYKAFVRTDTGGQRQVSTYENNGSFGELALLYSMPRSATVTAVTDGSVWCLDRGTFRKIVLKSAFKKRKLYEELIEQVPMLHQLNPFERTNLADSLSSKTFQNGDIIMREGDEPDGMYFVESGKVVIRKKDKDKEVILTTINKGGYFGELALVTKSERAASAYAIGVVRCAFLNIEAFERLLGPCKEIMARNAEKYKAAQTDDPDGVTNENRD
ncbi:cAMP-dependent protein kinase type II regulatory subunit-like [Cimex lectularius]|uniref:cAMP-dependent protein kinase type II regulatory subunit n=1 Tax=Cimex lectularius TaxID=79782 RepID=A0A8I6RMV1_CIMLE|nr:cAMP-dependent protein kinase type II regulatory subunit-like [Cimex lectularius]